MKASFSVLAALVLVSQAHAQQQYVDQYGNPVQVATAQKAVQYDEATNTVVEVTPTNTQNVHVQQTPIVLQQAPVYQVMRQEQPVTVVEGKHLRDSKADSLRKARTDMETDTEHKIVEKLEEARMRDEAARAEKLFGGASASASASAAAFGSGAAAAASASATAIVVAPAPTPAPAPIMVQPVAPPTVEVVGASASAAAAASASGSTAAASAAAEAKLEVRTESEPVFVRSEIRERLEDREPVRRHDKQQLYIGALAGMGEYPDVINMQGNGSTGFAVGVVTKNRVVVEGSFQYSGYDIEDLQYGSSGAFPIFKELTQYNTSAAIKFQILPGSFRPFLGGVASYVHRTYSNAQNNYYGSAADCSTQAVDVGVTAGLDLSITDNFAVGADFKYMTNVTSRQDSQYKQSIVSQNNNFGTPVEELQYYTLSVVGKFLF